ncbi:cytochrome-c peroxidase [Candidatus Albibeggiatoa sp. nov. NOAA]|uniref:cytochrome-c peroxidase n=1 Tax=Candidatus Albibeggiatoa sp. nov. NOAA TaxID=3162724 RepID=UPI003304545A|nr:cytochrome-c peroxidase [Thiotrichaceae bacterium]
MWKLSYLIPLILGSVLGVVLWQQYEPIELDESVYDGKNLALEPIRPIPNNLYFNARKVQLGNILFHDPRLSHDNTISCASCHNLIKGGVDGTQTSIGINGAVGPINAPTVFNSGFNFRQFWDGRAKNLEEQAEGPIHNPIEMGSNWREVIMKLEQDTYYIEQFSLLYLDGLTSKNIQDAIATFERSLYTPNSRFDRYLRGDDAVLTEKEKLGYQRFKAYGCISCHQGMNIGGNMFQHFGVMGNYFEDRGNITQVDLGRYNVTQNPADKFVFKVPSLRNIALTAPYFHDGSAETLPDAVKVMGRYQLGRMLSDEDVELLVAFLKTLTGEYNGQPL